MSLYDQTNIQAKTFPETFREYERMYAQGEFDFKAKKKPLKTVDNLWAIFWCINADVRNGRRYCRSLNFTQTYTHEEALKIIAGMGSRYRMMLVDNNGRVDFAAMGKKPNDKALRILPLYCVEKRQENEEHF